MTACLAQRQLYGNVSYLYKMEIHEDSGKAARNFMKREVWGRKIIMWKLCGFQVIIICTSQTPSRNTLAYFCIPRLKRNEIIIIIALLKGGVQ